MKSHFPSFLLGVVIGFTLAVSPVAYGASKNVVRAVFENLNYQVYGMDVVVTEPALVHEGNTYLRTREIARILGYNAFYDAETRTINFVPVDDERESGGGGLSTVVDPIEKEIQELDRKINILKRNIEGTERVKNLFDIPEEDIQKMREELESLESQKAELEAQLQAQQ